MWLGWSGQATVFLFDRHEQDQLLQNPDFERHRPQRHGALLLPQTPKSHVQVTDLLPYFVRAAQELSIWNVEQDMDMLLAWYATVHLRFALRSRSQPRVCPGPRHQLPVRLLPWAAARSPILGGLVHLALPCTSAM